MKTVLASFFAILSFSAVVQAGDRIGSGAGVWVCENANSDIFDIMLMDIYEAQREYKLTIPERAENADQLVQEKKRWIEKFLPNSSKLVENIEYVEKNITWIDDILVSIPDAANRTIPHPSTCKQGKWNPVQLVNFTEDYRILVRRDLFQSTMMSEVERAAVYLHEGIYSYLRSEFGDTTSVRTRAIVGFLFSNLKDSEKLEQIQKKLGSQKPPEPPPTPSNAWMCGLKPDVFAPLYLSEAKTEAEARASVVEVCKKGEDPFSGGGGFPMPGNPGNPGGGNVSPLPGFPGGMFPGANGGGFPGFPGSGGFPGGPGSECKAASVLCEPIMSSAKTHHCELPRMNKPPYVGYGRTVLEARHEVMSQCRSNEGSNSCYTSSDITCQ